MQKLSIDDAVQVAEQLVDVDWSWSVNELNAALEAADIRLLHTVSERSISIEHPGLPKVHGYVEIMSDGHTVHSISVSLTEVIDQSDPAASATLASVYEEYDRAFCQRFGDPHWRPKAAKVGWEVNGVAVLLRNLKIAIDMAVMPLESM